MDAYFYWTGVTVNIGATIALCLVTVWLFLEWYIKAANMKRLFLQWQWERLTKKRDAYRLGNGDENVSVGSE